MFKKVIAFLLTVTVTASVAIGGTLAYLQDQDSDVNVMTLGNVKIEQHEYERATNEDGTYKTGTIDDRTSYVLQDFTQGKPLLPSALNTTTWEGWGWDEYPVRNSQVGSYGGMSVFKDASNAQDKFVFVENTGKTDAYVRTLVAVEVGTSSINMMNFNVHLGAWTENEIGIITVDGNNYYLLEYVYTGAQLSDGSWRHENGILPAGDTTYNSFAQVYIHSKATNEDMEAIDGNNNGVLDILVLSQAVQAAGFEDAQTALDTAFGTADENAATWFGGENFVAPTAPYVSNPDELLTALENGEKTIILDDDIDLMEDTTIEIKEGEEVTLDLNGHTIHAQNTRTATHNFVIDVKGGELTIQNGTITMEHTGTNMGWSGATTVIDVTAGGVLNLDGVTVENKGGTDMNFAVHLNNWGEVTMNADNCVFKAPYCSVRVFNSGPDMNNVKITNSTLTGNKMAFWVHNYDASDLGTWYYTGSTGAYDKALVDARLNLEIYNNNNSFEVASNAYPSPIRYGFNSGVYYNADGTIVE